MEVAVTCRNSQSGLFGHSQVAESCVARLSPRGALGSPSNEPLEAPRPAQAWTQQMLSDEARGRRINGRQRPLGFYPPAFRDLELNPKLIE